jgi:translation initiation factor 2B subunit (eIF-2B alpha/beta/delta family)
MDTRLGLDEEIKRIGSDEEKGATELAMLSALALNRCKTLEEMRVNADTLLYLKPMMAPIVNLAAGVKACSSLADAQRFVRNFMRSMQEGQDKVATQFVSAILKKYPQFDAVVTVSASRVVEGCIGKLSERQKSLKVVVAESRPKMEGTALAKRLRARVKDVYITWDASIFAFVRRGVIALVGADAVLKDSLVNKAPTLALCIVAKANRVPVLVVTTSHKVLEPKAEPYFVLPKPRQIEHEGVSILDHQFDLVPRSLVDCIITENGILG